MFIYNSKQSIYANKYTASNHDDLKLTSKVGRRKKMTSSPALSKILKHVIFFLHEQLAYVKESKICRHLGIYKLIKVEFASAEQ
jgi:hypothetical protein